MLVVSGETVELLVLT